MNFLSRVRFVNRETFNLDVSIIQLNKKYNIKSILLINHDSCVRSVLPWDIFSSKPGTQRGFDLASA